VILPYVPFREQFCVLCSIRAFFIILPLPWIEQSLYRALPDSQIHSLLYHLTFFLAQVVVPGTTIADLGKATGVATKLASQTQACLVLTTVITLAAVPAVAVAAVVVVVAAAIGFIISPANSSSVPNITKLALRWCAHGDGIRRYTAIYHSKTSPQKPHHNSSKRWSTLIPVRYKIYSA
jgi:hypothetical protein